MPDTLTAHEHVLLSALESALRWLNPVTPFAVKRQITDTLAESYRMQDMGRSTLALSHPPATLEERDPWTP